MIAYFFGEHDPPRQQSRNLLEHQSLTTALHSDDILLILLSGSRAHCVEEFPFLVDNFPNDALYWRTIHVHIDHAQEDTDTTPAAAVLGGRDIGNFTVRWRYDSARGIRDDAIRVTEEPKEKSCQNQQRQCPKWARHPGKQESSPDQWHRVIVTIRNHWELWQL